MRSASTSSSKRLSLQCGDMDAKYSSMFRYVAGRRFFADFSAAEHPFEFCFVAIGRAAIQRVAARVVHVHAIGRQEACVFERFACERLALARSSSSRRLRAVFRLAFAKVQPCVNPGWRAAVSTWQLRDVAGLPGRLSSAGEYGFRGNNSVMDGKIRRCRSGYDRW